MFSFYFDGGSYGSCSLAALLWVHACLLETMSPFLLQPYLLPKGKAQELHWLRGRRLFRIENGQSN